MRSSLPPGWRNYRLFKTSIRGMVNVRHARNLIGFSCLLVVTTAASCVQVRGAEPAVSSIAVISSPARDGTYEVGEEVRIVVDFDRAVTATGSPQVALTIGTETRYATFSGWGRKSLYFYYIVQAADRDDDGISIAANAVVLNRATIMATDGTTDADLTHGAVAAGRRNKVDGRLVATPGVRSIALLSSPARGDTYEMGEEVEVAVEFDRAVTVTGNPRLALTIGTETRYATFFGGSKQSVYFSYIVQAADRDENGISIAANALVLNGGTITAADGTTDADLTHRASGTKRRNKVDGSLVAPPRVMNVALLSSPARGDTYEMGEEVEVAVEFDKAVTATGNPQVALTIGTQTRHATSFGWSRKSLYFSYIVQAADRDKNGISIAANALVLNGGTIMAADGTTDADLKHGAVNAGRRNKVNGSLIKQPELKWIAVISSPAQGDTFGLGEKVQVEVDFDRAVTATGKPQVALTIGAQIRHATYTGWGLQSLYFAYTVQATDRDEDGISVASNSLSLDGGTIKAADGTTDADLTHAAVTATRGNKVNGSLITPPGVKDVAFVSSPARGHTYELGETIEVRVEFDKGVTVIGSPQVALTIGTQTRQAPYSLPWGDARYAHFSYAHFSYAVQEGDRDEDGISISANALALNGGSIRHAADPRTDANIAHSAVAADPAHRLNGSLVTRPTVGAIYLDNHVPPPSGHTYVRGEIVRVWVEFDRDVMVTGSPRVSLTIGSLTRQATYSGFSTFIASGGDMIVDEGVLFFEYLVQATDRDEDGISIPADALILNGGAITAADGTTDAHLGHDAVAADPGRKVNGSRSTP